jgi:hypothetical protein
MALPIIKGEEIHRFVLLLLRDAQVGVAVKTSLIHIDVMGQRRSSWEDMPPRTIIPMFVGVIIANAVIITTTATV